MKAKSISDIIFIITLVLLAIIFGAGVYAQPKQSFSEEENRVLAGAPEFSINSLLSGEFFDDLNSFHADKIPLRVLMIRAKAVCELSLGKKENNGVLFSDDGRMADRTYYGDLDILKQNIARADRLKEDGAILALVPRSADVYFRSNESSRICEISGELPLLDILSDVGPTAYYYTDHHLDADGAFAVYQYIMEALGKTPILREDLQLTAVSDSFLGTAYSKGGLLPLARDTVSTWRYSGDEDMIVKCSDVGCNIHSLYAPSELSVKDKYRYFLAGNHGVLTVSSNDGIERERLFIIKDSFANSIIPLLAAHFDLTVWDPRYSPIPSEVQSEGTRTVLLCGIDTLATVKGFLN